MNSPELQAGSGLVLLAPGGLADPAVAERLAALLGLRLHAAWAGDPTPLLAALADQPPGWLLPLPIDPGQDLSEDFGHGGCWAEALGAWRQPAMLLIPTQAPSGAPRAYSALLQGAGVPLLGLIQLGGSWNPEERRRDGLPWLGCLPLPHEAQDRAQPGSGCDPSDDAIVDLLAACRRRWREISAARPAGALRHPPGATDRPA